MGMGLRDAVDRATLAAVRRFLASLPAQGIHPVRAVIFGSHARGEQGPHSDIDVVVVAPEFDGAFDRAMRRRLRYAVEPGVRIDPIACGVAEWDSNAARPILDIARGEGIEVLPEPGAPVR